MNIIYLIKNIVLLLFK